MAKRAKKPAKRPSHKTTAKAKSTRKTKSPRKGVSQAAAACARDMAPLTAKLRESDVKSMRDEIDTCSEAMAEACNFHAYRRALQSLHSAQKRLSPATLDAYGQRFDRHIAAYDAYVGAIGRYHTQLQSHGILKVMEQHLPALCRNFPDTSLGKSVYQRFRGMGIAELDLTDFSKALRKADWSPLHMHGGNGRLDYFVERSAGELKTLRRMREAEGKHGFPAVEGACNTGDQIVLAVVVGGAIVACAFIPPCAALFAAIIIA